MAPTSQGLWLVFVISLIQVFAAAGCSPCEYIYDLVTGPHGVSDTAITASSTHPSCPVVQARFTATESWCPGSNGSGHYLQVAFPSLSYLKTIQTMGRGRYDQWVTSFRVNTSMDGLSWTSLNNASGNVKVFPGNQDKNTVVTNALGGTVVARYIRVISVSIQSYGSMKLEVQGCPYSEINGTCHRWEAKLGSTGDVLPVLLEADTSNPGLCAVKCFRQSGCGSFLFDITSARCRLLKATMDGSQVTVNLDGVWYFVKT